MSKLCESGTPVETSSLKSDNLSDEDDNFVVLDESSDATQASSVDSNVDIQRKNISLDHNKSISPRTIYEIQQQILSIIEENTMLKKTLERNTLSMEHKYNVLSNFHEEMIKRGIYEKFENSLTTIEKKASKQDIKNLDKPDTLSLLIQQYGSSKALRFIASEGKNKHLLNVKRTQNMPDLQESENIEKHTHVTSSSRLNLEEAVTIEKLEEMEKEIESTTKSATSESKTCAITKSVKNPLKLFEDLEDVETFSADSEEIAYLNQKIATLVKHSRHVFTPIQLCDVSELVAKKSSNFKVNYKILSENVKQYNETLQKLNEYFLAEIARFVEIERNIKEITKLFVTLCTYCNKLVHDLNYKEHTEDYKKLCRYSKQLAKEHMDIIVAREDLLKSQNQFQKIFWDYQTVVYELEIIIDENTKLNMLNIASEKSQQVEKSEHIEEEKQQLEELRNFLSQEKENLKKEKALLEKDKEQLQEQNVTLSRKEERLKKWQIEIANENTSLKHKCETQENIIKDLRQQALELDKECDSLCDEGTTYKTQIASKEEQINSLHAQLKENKDKLFAMHEKLQLYKDEFVHKEKSYEALLKLVDNKEKTLTQHIKYGEQLKDLLRLHGINTSTIKKPNLSKEESKNDDLPPCPKCSMIFPNSSDLQEHVIACIDLS